MKSGLNQISELLDVLNNTVSDSTIVSSLPLCIHEISLDGKLCKMNPAGLKMLSVGSESNIIGDDYIKYVHTNDSIRILKLLEDATNGITSQFKFKSPNGKYFSSCFVPIISNNVVKKIVGYTYDITEYYGTR